MPTLSQTDKSLQIASAFFAVAAMCDNADCESVVQCRFSNSHDRDARHGMGPWGLAAEGAKRALMVAFGADLAQGICDRVWDCGEYSPEDLQRHACEEMERMREENNDAGWTFVCDLIAYGVKGVELDSVGARVAQLNGWIKSAGDHVWVSDAGMETYLAW